MIPIDILKAIDAGCRKRREITDHVSADGGDVGRELRRLSEDGLIEYLIYWGPTGWYLTARGQRALVHALTA